MKRTPTGVVLLPMALLSLAASPLAGQAALTRVEENFRAEPNGAVLGVLEPETALTVLQQRDRWIEGTLEGWMWARSLQVTTRAGFDLLVSEPSGENLRLDPSGRIVGRLQEGTLLEEVERTAGWIRVRRRGWIWEPSVRLEASTPGGAATQSAEPAPDTSPGSASTDPSGEGDGVGAVLSVGERGAAVLGGPDGDTLARVLPETDLQVVAREGSWLRVRVEGWVWAPPGAGTPAETDDGVGVTPLQVVQDPDLFRGRVVRWELQFISLERAERIRTDFFEGEPFLLTRSLDGEGGFVYVAIAPDRLSELDGLLPLERITVVGRVRTGASALTGSPILDLLELRPERAARQRR